MGGRRRARGAIRPGVVTVASLAIGVAAAIGSRLTWRAEQPRHAAFEPCVVWTLREIGRCGTVTVAEDRDRAARDAAAGRPFAGRTIPIHVVVLRARGPGPVGAPIVLLAGGPGQGATTGGMVSYAQNALGDLRARHDLILADQRGTGQSNPLACDLAGDALQPHVAPWLPVDAVRRCRARLAGRADLTQYTTARSADDLADVLDALGARRAHVFGVSYGGRLALTFLRRHPERVRTVVAQSGPPPERVIPLAAAAAGAHALTARAAECRAERACAATTAADPVAELRAVLDGLAARPVRVTRWNWRRLRREEVTVTRRAFTEYSWSRLYGTGDAHGMFGLTHRAALGHWDEWVDAAATRGRWREYARSRGLTLSVLCTEDAPRIARADTAALAEASPLGLPLATELVAACAEWPRGTVAPDDTLPVRSDTPVLLLSGALDPVVPPGWADSAAAFLPAAWHLIAPGEGHAVMDACTRAVIGRFVEQGGSIAATTGCARGWEVARWAKGLLANGGARR